MPGESELRIDKYLWAVRIYKTRALSAEACKKGKVLVNGISVKASHLVKPGETINVKKPPVLYSYIVKDTPKSRVSAKLVADYINDITPKEELQKLEQVDDFFIKRDRGTGRPTKKERRTIDKLRQG